MRWHWFVPILGYLAYLRNFMLAGPIVHEDAHIIKAAVMKAYHGTCLVLILVACIKLLI